MKFYRTSLCMAAIVLLTGCSDNKRNINEEISDCAKVFSESFFNFDFKTSFSLCSPDNNGWLRMYVSSVTEEDIKVIQAVEESPTVKVERTEAWGDSLAVAWVKVGNALLLDSIAAAKSPTLHDATMKLYMENRRGKWLVRKADLQRNGK